MSGCSNTWRLESASTTIPITTEVPLGRATLGMAFGGVSRQQAVIRIDDGEAFLCSLGTNATMVTRAGLLHKLSKGDNLALQDGDAIILDAKNRANTSFILRAPAAAAAVPDAAAAAPLAAASSAPGADSSSSSAPVAVSSAPAAAAASAQPAAPSLPADTAVEAPAARRRPHAFRLTRLAPEWGLPACLNDEAVGIDDLLGEEALSGAVEVQLHSYLLDLDWLVAACPALARVPKVFVLHGDGRCLRASCLRAPEHTGRFVVLEPPTHGSGKGVHHSKMILVRRNASLSVHITSANLTLNGFAAKTNGVWSGTFPKRAGISPAEAPVGLEADLISYLTAVRDLASAPPSDFVVHRLDPDDAHGATAPSKTRPASLEDARAWDGFDLGWLEEQRAYDISGAAEGGVEVRLVCSVPPRNPSKGHAGTDFARWGQTRLRSLLATIDDASFRQAPLVLQFSSSGISGSAAGWVAQMVEAFCPRSDARAAPPPVRVVYPTTQEVRDSLEGWAAGCSIPNSDSRQMTECLAELSSRPGWDARLCRWAGGERARAVPHMKTFTRAGGDEGTSAPWVVMGSHNFSKVERRGAAYTRLPHPTSPFLLLPPALCPARFPHPSHLAFLPLPHSSPSPLPHRRPPGARSRARCCAR